MADHSKIEWTETTWNIVTGCTRVSEGCDHCYIERTPPFRMAGRRFDKPGVGGTTGVQLHPERLDQPLRWRKPRRVFVNSLSDLFHDTVPDEFIASTFAAMALTPRHTYQVLTKRPARMRAMLNSPNWRGRVAGHARKVLPDQPVDEFDAVTMGFVRTGVLDHVWLGVSVESQRWADVRVPVLLGTPAAVRWLSCEPLLGPVDLTRIAYTAGGGTRLDVVHGRHGEPGLWAAPGKCIDWVVAGGESGPKARPMHPDWARQLRDQCRDSGVPFFFKQWGSWGPGEWCPERQPGEDVKAFKTRAEAIGATHALMSSGHLYEPNHKPWSAERAPLANGETAAPLRRWNKKRDGRQLDGRTWEQYPGGGL